MTKEEALIKNGVHFDNFELDNEHSAKNILLAMDEYARSRAIAFDKWKYLNQMSEDYMAQHTHTSEELYNLFLNSQKNEQH